MKMTPGIKRRKSFYLSKSLHSTTLGLIELGIRVTGKKGFPGTCQHTILFRKENQK
jgi:hypothetical protein